MSDPVFIGYEKLGSIHDPAPLRGPIAKRLTEAELRRLDVWTEEAAQSIIDKRSSSSARTNRLEHRWKGQTYIED